jgi:hypothetical protein
MSYTSDYQALVKAKGWIYLDQLPANTELGPKVAGYPGARGPRQPNTATSYGKSPHELAPAGVQLEQGFKRAITAIEVAAAPVQIGIGSAVEDLAAATGLDHGVPGVLAKALGIPPWLLLVAASVGLYAWAQQQKLVPPVRELFK